MIDVIIPCFNAETTLTRAVQSVITQPQLGTLWLVDDASTDGTLALARALQAQFPQKIQVEALPQNGGAAKARNWGALQSCANTLAFLDADDAYTPEALQMAEAIFAAYPNVNVVRLGLQPIDLPARYANHPKFAQAWQTMQMTGAGNVLFRRAFFLACGGFPQQAIFRQFGGEDGALGIATTQLTTVATLFNEVGVLNYCREGMHAERLLNAILFEQADPRITPEAIAEAEQITAQIVQQVKLLGSSLNTDQTGILPITLTWG